MADGQNHLEEALRGCAETGITDEPDPWPAVRRRGRAARGAGGA